MPPSFMFRTPFPMGNTTHPSGPNSNIQSSVIHPEIPAEIPALYKFFISISYKICHTVLWEQWPDPKYLCISPSSSPAILHHHPNHVHVQNPFAKPLEPDELWNSKPPKLCILLLTMFHTLQNIFGRFWGNTPKLNIVPFHPWEKCIFTQNEVNKKFI